jgi:GMP synthase (glutamine-hydrolysing)
VIGEQVPIQTTYGSGATAGDPVLVVDFGAQYAQLIARRIREARVYSEIVPHDITAEELRARRPAAVVLSGGPASVYATGAPTLDAAILELDIPTFGICYGFQAMATTLGGTVERTGRRSSAGRRSRSRRRTRRCSTACPREQSVWMSHGDAVTAAPAGFEVVARTDGTPVAAFEDHATGGSRGCSSTRRSCTVRARAGRARALPLRDRRLPPTWTTANVIDEQVARIRDPGRRQARDLRPVRRGRLGGRGGARAARGR